MTLKNLDTKIRAFVDGVIASGKTVADRADLASKLDARRSFDHYRRPSRSRNLCCDGQRDARHPTAQRRAQGLFTRRGGFCGICDHDPGWQS